MAPSFLVSRGPRLVLSAAATLIVGVLFAADSAALWKAVGVPPRDPAWIDLRNITSGWECIRDGVDVRSFNPCDPANRPMNYTNVWRWAAVFGLGEVHTSLLAVTLFVLFGIATFRLSEGCRWRDVPLWLAAICSPPVLLGLERANADLLIFALVVAAAYLPKPRALLVLIAAVLKLFPIFGVAVLILRKQYMAAGIVTAAFALFVALTVEDLRLIYETTMKGALTSYGTAALGATTGLGTLSASVFAAAVVTLAAVRRPLKGSRFSDPYILGAAIFVGTFFLGNNWDYRLVFTLLLVPSLLRHSYVALALLLATLWISGYPGLSPVDDILTVALLGVVVGYPPTKTQDNREREPAASPSMFSAPPEF